jgi:hypothetical protein
MPGLFSWSFNLGQPDNSACPWVQGRPGLSQGHQLQAAKPNVVALAADHGAQFTALLPNPRP